MRSGGGTSQLSKGCARPTTDHLCLDLYAFMTHRRRTHERRSTGATGNSPQPGTTFGVPGTVAPADLTWDDLAIIHDQDSAMRELAKGFVLEGDRMVDHVAARFWRQVPPQKPGHTCDESTPCTLIRWVDRTDPTQQGVELQAIEKSEVSCYRGHGHGCEGPPE